jgi:hypothetical protein
MEMLCFDDPVEAATAEKRQVGSKTRHHTCRRPMRIVRRLSAIDLFQFIAVN